tara:strand:+ start:2152 stop:2754 length:603 start_codon:yes stop_codon:yes gene_type:complete
MKNKLKIMLKHIIPCIEGPWFVADGGLLGIMREGDLLDFDDDIDIYILPSTKINWDKLPKKYKYYKDYTCYKIYNSADKVVKSNEWLRYISYKRTLPEYYGCNRAELCEAIAVDYKKEKITRKYPNTWIDIFVLVYDPLHNIYRIPQHWNGTEFYFTPFECEGTYDTTLGFEIKIPKNPKKVLERIYGSEWLKENKLHIY